LIVVQDVEELRQVPTLHRLRQGSQFWGPSVKRVQVQVVRLKKRKMRVVRLKMRGRIPTNRKVLL
jgi:hypothetical protein